RCSSPSTVRVIRVLAPDSPARMCVSSRPGTVRLVVSVSRPYITAGTLPSRRSRPAGRLPTTVRDSAVSVLLALSAMGSGLVGAVVPHERLHKLDAAVHLELAPRFALQLADGLGDIALDEARVVPLECVQGPGGDVLRHRVQHRGDLVVRIGDARPVPGEDL